MKALRTGLIVSIIQGLGIYLMLQMPKISEFWVRNLIVGILEESLKILCVFPIFLLCKDRKVFLLSAVAFAIIENILYIYSRGTIEVFMARWLICLPLHISFSILFLSFYKNWKGFVIGLILSICFHICMNVFSNWDLVLVPFLSSWFLIFLSFKIEVFAQDYKTKKFIY